MNNLTKLANISIPAIVGLGVTWLGLRLINNEKKIEVRRMELELQLHAKSLKGF